MIKLITAPNILENDNCLKVFLAGGIQKCEDWQNEIAEYLMKCKWQKDIALINPRQPSFDMEDPLAAEKQITWEFNHLNNMDVFTMFFYGPTESDQPICFYELGRYIEVIKKRFPEDWENRIVVTTCKNFKRYEDVLVQTKLATNGKIIPLCGDDYRYAIEMHKLAVTNMLKNL